MGDWSGSHPFVPRNPARCRTAHTTPVKRRFNDFITLNAEISQRFSRAALPPLPGRRWFGSLSPDTVSALGYGGNGVR
jgi:hypothetical protein